MQGDHGGFDAMKEAVLDKPTVKELIEFLKEHCPQDVPIRIEDADTNWEIHKIHINFANGKIWLSGQYQEMGPDDGPGA
jgi:hypothetical protein